MNNLFAFAFFIFLIIFIISSIIWLIKKIAKNRNTKMTRNVTLISLLITVVSFFAFGSTMSKSDSSSSNSSNVSSSSSKREKKAKSLDLNTVTLPKYLDNLNNSDNFFSSASRNGNIVTVKLIKKDFEDSGQEFQKTVLKSIATTIIRASKNSNDTIEQVIFKEDGNDVAQWSNGKFTFNEDYSDNSENESSSYESSSSSSSTKVTMEDKNALESAKEYVGEQYMSQNRLYEQLTSSYGDSFTPEAAQYAIDQLNNKYNIDWNKVALASAKEYQSEQHMSKNGVYQQLTSDSEGFTSEQAQYAVNHLQN